MPVPVLNRALLRASQSVIVHAGKVYGDNERRPADLLRLFEGVEDPAITPDNLPHIL